MNLQNVSLIVILTITSNNFIITTQNINNNDNNTNINSNSYASKLSNDFEYDFRFNDYKHSKNYVDEVK
jgi:hypothetical protein